MRIQRYFFMHVTGRKLLEVARVDRLAWDRNKRQFEASRRVQQFWRARAARRKLVELINSLYTKFIDPNTGAPYYYNKLLNQKSWCVVLW